ncbi:alpha/beta hydrolase-fold protein [Tamlana sp. 2201CG12-4]|uniref:alpha/beta hydrolase n=1 Tax=Tamlana sp. 2201CG12-4 TaxID=3112582 RepID=UPI002DB81489|nr:alpha/beta hydrolase-fold protein [Tamlana sp. 2201CG12-4]MEC3907632.1 alpha/beta hydrolase-fold protein [Tamlana sp. 2201CG12-4]
MRFIILTLILFPIIMQPQEANYYKETEFLREKALNPDSYILEKFKYYDVLLLGEDHAVKNNLDFIKQLIPDLYNSGVYNLGMEFGAYEKQSELDTLVTGHQYNDQIARDLMFFYNVGWAFKEYTDFYKAVWNFNQTLPQTAKKFRIINISYQYDWTAYSGSRLDMSGVFHKGEVNEFREKVIKKEVLDKGEKALVLVGVPHAFTKYSQATTQDNDCTFKFESLGNRLYKKYPDKVFSIFLHGPLYNKQNKTPFFLSPANGQTEAIFKLMSYAPMGFDLDNNPIGKLRDDSMFSVCYDNFTIGQLFDGYIFLVPFNKMEDCKIDQDFFKGKEWPEIKKQIPDPYWHEPFYSKQQYWEDITSKVNIKTRYKSIISKPNLTLKYGKIDRLKDFQSKFIDSRNVDLWLPPGYNPKLKYSVLYMHDGQMLFDATNTWNNQEWMIDETFSKLMSNGVIKNTIVVGIWNNGKFRHSEYFPQKPIELLDEKIKKTLIETDLQGKAQSDNYLRFIVEELKPYIDSNYSTFTNKEDTFVAGSSMGGLISMYALCEYPEIFGGAACLSTHWVGDVNIKGDKIPLAFNTYMSKNLPSYKDHKIYFDYGTEGLDSLYKEWQLRIDKTMSKKGYSSKNWISKEFKGKEHSEEAWSERFHIPMEFLLKAK